MLSELFFRLDARGRRRLAPMGWATLAVGIFVGVGLAAFGIRLYSDRIVEPLATESPGTIVPAGVDGGIVRFAESAPHTDKPALLYP